MAGSVSSGFSDEDDAVMSDINVTPLVDVTLVLLIVFMITVPAIVGSAPIKVNLPDTGAVAMADELPPLTVSVKRDDAGKITIFLNERGTTEEGLPALIKELGYDQQKDMPITLAGDKLLPYGDVIRIMDTLHGIGLKKINIDTKHVQSH
jgi:biopolymer transport protein ExbD